MPTTEFPWSEAIVLFSNKHIQEQIKHFDWFIEMASISRKSERNILMIRMPFLCLHRHCCHNYYSIGSNTIPLNDFVFINLLSKMCDLIVGLVCFLFSKIIQTLRLDIAEIIQTQIQTQTQSQNKQIIVIHDMVAAICMSCVSMQNCVRCEIALFALHHELLTVNLQEFEFSNWNSCCHSLSYSPVRPVFR